MPPPLTAKKAALVFSLLSFVIGTLVVAAPQIYARHAHAKTTSNAAAPGCSSVTDAQIVSRIRRKIRKTPRLNKVRKDISVLSNNREVTLDGCALRASDIARLVKYAKSIHCVKKVTNNMRVCNPAACLPGQTKCADGDCIPRGMLCPPPPKPK